MEVKGNSVKGVPPEGSCTGYDAVRGPERRPVKRTVISLLKLRVTPSQKSGN